MSDEFDHNSEPRFSSFIPLTITLGAFIIWFLFQDYELNQQRSLLNQNIARAQPTVAEAIQVSQRYVALMKDLVKTAQQPETAPDLVVYDAKNSHVVEFRKCLLQAPRLGSHTHGVQQTTRAR